MKQLVMTAMAAAIAISATIATAPAAEARDGCGRGGHRNYNGRCVANRGQQRVIVAPRLVIGRFYTNRGYWDGRRYWRERYRYQNRWRYR